MNNKECFNNVVEDILENAKFQSLKDELHHGISRYEHSLRVAKVSYKLAKMFKFKNKDELTRAALLHDFYVNCDFSIYKSSEVLHTHPYMALKNAKHYFSISDMQEDIIKKHMFPLTLDIPKFKESWLVSLADKIVASYEMYRFKASLQINVLLIFLFNFITLNK